MELPIFKLLTAYAMKRKFGTHTSWSYITRSYEVEMREIVYYKNSGMPYMMSRANRSGDNPLEALVAVLPVVLPSTPLLKVLLLEAECVLLGLAVDRAQDIGAMLDKVLDELWQLLCLVRGYAMRHEMQEAALHRQIDVKVGAPRRTLMEKIVEIADVHIPLTGIPADPGEDDDL